MTTIKSYTDLEQSKKLSEILPLESADMYWKNGVSNKYIQCFTPFVIDEDGTNVDFDYDIPCWSLAALLKCLSEIKPQVCIPVLFPSEGKWILRFVEYGHGNVCEECDIDPVDACYEMIIKLHELKML